MSLIYNLQKIKCPNVFSTVNNKEVITEKK